MARAPDSVAWIARNPDAGNPFVSLTCARSMSISYYLRRKRTVTSEQAG